MNQKLLGGVDQLCNRVMVGVAAMIRGCRDIRDINYEQVADIMRQEVKAFFFGEAYRDERECVLLGSLSHTVIITSIVTRCFDRIIQEGAAVR